MAGLYTAAINALYDSDKTDSPAFYAAKRGSTAASTAASKLATDYETLLNSLDAIPFPPTAKDDVSTFKKAVTANQVFWSNVSIADSNYSAFTDHSTSDAYNQTSILLGHDIGVDLVIEKPSPSPTR